MVHLMACGLSGAALGMFLSGLFGNVSLVSANYVSATVSVSLFGHTVFQYAGPYSAAHALWDDLALALFAAYAVGGFIIGWILGSLTSDDTLTAAT